LRRNWFRQSSEVAKLNLNIACFLDLQEFRFVNLSGTSTATAALDRLDIKDKNELELRLTRGSRRRRRSNPCNWKVS
jgi:hypothetical protein